MHSFFLVPDAADLPEPSVYLRPHNGSCNSYLPDTNGLGRLLWTVQYLVANGFYVVVRHPVAVPRVLHHASTQTDPR